MFTPHKTIYRVNEIPKISVVFFLETIKLLEENIGNKLIDISLGNFLKTISPQKQSNKRKNRKVGLHQTKMLLSSKETINEIKRQLTEWEIVFVNHVSDKWLISKIYKELK